MDDFEDGDDGIDGGFNRNIEPDEPVEVNVIGNGHADVDVDIDITFLMQKFGPILHKYSGQVFLSADILLSATNETEHYIGSMTSRTKRRNEEHVYDLGEGKINHLSLATLSVAEGLSKIVKRLVKHKILTGEFASAPAREDWKKLIIQEAMDWLRTKELISNLGKPIKNAETDHRTEKATLFCNLPDSHNEDIGESDPFDFIDREIDNSLNNTSQLKSVIDDLSVAICKHKTDPQQMTKTAKKRRYGDYSVSTYFDELYRFIRRAELEETGYATVGGGNGFPVGAPQLHNLLLKIRNLPVRVIEKAETEINALKTKLVRVMPYFSEIQFIHEAEKVFEKLDYTPSLELREYINAAKSESGYESWGRILEILNARRNDFSIFLISRTNLNNDEINATESALAKLSPEIQKDMPCMPHSYNSESAYIDEMQQALDRYFRKCQTPPKLNVENLHANALALSNIPRNTGSIASSYLAIIEALEGYPPKGINRVPRIVRINYRRLRKDGIISRDRLAAISIVEARATLAIYLRCVQVFFAEVLFDESRNEIEKQKESWNETRREEDKAAKEYQSDFKKHLLSNGWNQHDIQVVWNIINAYFNDAATSSNSEQNVNIATSNVIRGHSAQNAQNEISTLINRREQEKTAHNNEKRARVLSLKWLNKYEKDLYVASGLAAMPEPDRLRAALKLVCEELWRFVQLAELNIEAKRIADAIVQRKQIFYDNNYKRKQNVDTPVAMIINQTYGEDKAKDLLAIWEKLASRVNNLRSICDPAEEIIGSDIFEA